MVVIIDQRPLRHWVIPCECAVYNDICTFYTRNLRENSSILICCTGATTLRSLRLCAFAGACAIAKAIGDMRLAQVLR
jgi:hypothetical protein